MSCAFDSSTILVTIAVGLVIGFLGKAIAPGDRDNIPSYPYDRMAKNSMTVGAWRATRFHPAYVGFDVDVLDARGSAVAGNTRLATVRDTYLGD